MTSGLDADYTERVDRRRARANIARVVVFIVLLNVAVIVGGEILAPSSEGPRGSTFSTEADGAGAWFELLGRIGVDVDRQRVPMSSADLQPDTTTLVILDPSGGRIEDADVDAVERFVLAGGRVVTTAGHEIIRRLIPGLTRGRAETTTADSVGSGSDVGDAQTVAFDSETYFDDARAGEPLVANQAGLPLVIGADLGSGRVLAVVDSTPFSNERIATEDNAAFAVGVTGGRAVVFDEFVHGYGVGEGLGGLPRALQTLAAVLVLAAVIWIWATGRRLGQPEQPGRALPPARVQFIDAMGATLSRATPDESAFGHLRKRGVGLLERYAHGRTDIASDELPELGLTPDELAALRQPVGSESDVAAVGSAVAKLERFTAGPIGRRPADPVDDGDPSNTNARNRK